MKRRLSKLPYPSAIFTLFLGVNENCLPSQIGHKVFFLPRGSEEADQIGPLFIALTPKSDTDRAPKGYRALTVFHYISSDGWHRGNEYVKKKDLTQEKTIRTLKKLIPFLDEGLCFCESATPLTYEKFTGRPKGMVNGLPQFRETYGNKALSCSTSYRDLFQISDCTSIGLGVEGLCQTSLNLTDRICKKYE
jgi:phytoene dehydrogenase-like protein